MVFGNKQEIPKKPQKQKDQIDQLWDAVYNHIPSKLGVLGIKVNFILVFMGLNLAFLAALMVLIVKAI